jgi:hypothetical protein
MTSKSKSPSSEASGAATTPGKSDWAHARHRLFLSCGAFSLVCLASGPVTGELTQSQPILAGGHTFWSLVLLVILAAVHGRAMRPRPTQRRVEVRVCSVIVILQVLMGIGVNVF